jgi:hypothetical protein
MTLGIDDPTFRGQRRQSNHRAKGGDLDLAPGAAFPVPMVKRRAGRPAERFFEDTEPIGRHLQLEP